MTDTVLPESIALIDDMHLGRPHIIATYLLRGDAPAVVDPGPTTTLATLEAGLNEHGIRLEDLRAIILTHIHLDHAAATGSIVRRNPDITVYVHQRGAPHMVNPERLISSATRLYGADMERLWGDFLPVPESQVVALSGGETIDLAGRKLHAHYTPGHASHHIAYQDADTGMVFVGDVAGVRLPGATYARPATPPPDVDLEQWHASLDLLDALDPTGLLLTHFGPAFDAKAHTARYRERLAAWAELVRADLQRDDLTDEQRVARLYEQGTSELDRPEMAAQYDHATPLDQSWQGLARYWHKRASR